jgi:hypothetical protein
MHRAFAWLAVLSLSAAAPAADVATLIERLQRVGPEGAGQADAVVAWAELARQDRNAVVTILTAMDRASPRAANWLLSALSAIVERERAAQRALPLDDLKRFLAERSHSGQARRIAFELIRSQDSAAANAMLPGFIDDPSLELRFEAIQTAFESAKREAKDSAEAKATLRRLVQASRDTDQVEAIAKELDNRGETVDFVKLYGFITQWNLCAGFDNAGGKGFATAYPPESKVDLAAAYAGSDGKEVKWLGHATADKLGMVDLNRVVGKLKNSVAYGYAVFESPEDRPVEIRAASATAIKMYLNGEEIFGRESYHQSFAIDSHIAPARLRKGRNTLLIKVCQNDQKEPWAQEWRFQVRVCDALGSPVPIQVQPVETKERP